MSKRKSNMELLRILAMVMVIAYHIFSHCINIQLTDTNAINEFGNDWYFHPCFSRKLCILAVISPMGQVGNAIFIIISGYFMVNKETINLTKVSKKLLFQLGFAAIILGLVSIYAYQNVTGLTMKLIPFSSFNTMSWYVGYYFIVIVLASAFINDFINKLEQKKYVMFMMVLLALTQFSWSVSALYSLGGGLETVCTGVFLYSLGGYIKKYNPFDAIRLWAVITVIVVTNLIVIGNFYISTAGNILEYNQDGESAFVQSIPTYGNNQIIPVILGIAIFELFRRIDVPNSCIINFVGASTFMVYLIHDNEFVYQIWNTQDWLTPLHEDVVRFLIVYIIWILKTFAAGFLCYCIFVIGEKILNICKPLAIKRSAETPEQIR